MRGDGTIILDILNLIETFFKFRVETKQFSGRIGAVDVCVEFRKSQMSGTRLAKSWRPTPTMRRPPSASDPDKRPVQNPGSRDSEHIDAARRRGEAGKSRSAVQWIMDKPETILKSRFVRFGASYILPIGTAPARS